MLPIASAPSERYVCMRVERKAAVCTCRDASCLVALHTSHARFLYSSLPSHLLILLDEMLGTFIRLA